MTLKVTEPDSEVCTDVEVDWFHDEMDQEGNEEVSDRAMLLVVGFEGVVTTTLDDADEAKVGSDPPIQVVRNYNEVRVPPGWHCFASIPQMLAAAKTAATILADTILRVRYATAQETILEKIKNRKINHHGRGPLKMLQHSSIIFSLGGNRNDSSCNDIRA